MTNGAKSIVFMERILNKNAYLRKDYNNFFNRIFEFRSHVQNKRKYCKRQISLLLTSSSNQRSSSTTKIWVVFDASAKSDSGISLNPVVQNDFYFVII